MSRCPDALVCETVFDSVLAKVADKVDLSLVFLAKLNTSDVDFGVTCKHGPEECAGNVQQLCVAAYSSFTQFWQFVQCNNYHGRWEIGNPDVAFSCAHASGIEWDGPVADCAGKDASGKTAEGSPVSRRAQGKLS
ncbi:hypothetical protein CPB85DRAFT_1429416 [Mucidula mucida]|nr:hypothetical protein CPB85DRAFT_1429416 [Mucidula mucida]